jgi:hypothetical protein
LAVSSGVGFDLFLCEVCLDLRIPKVELFSCMERPAAGPKRNLGCAILLAAIEDYRSLHEETHRDAKQFLFPRDAEWRERYDWAVSLAERFDPQWVREALDSRKEQWDQQRCGRLEARRRRRRLKRAVSAVS